MVLGVDILVVSMELWYSLLVQPWTERESVVLREDVLVSMELWYRLLVRPRANMVSGSGGGDVGRNTGTACWYGRGLRGQACFWGGMCRFQWKFQWNCGNACWYRRGLRVRASVVLGADVLGDSMELW